MNKLVGYTILILGTLCFLLLNGIVKTEMKNIVYEKNGLQFEYLDYKLIANPSHEPQFYTSKEGNELTFYMYDGTRNENHNIDLSIYKTTNPNENLQNLSLRALSNEVDYQEKKSDLDMNHMVGLVASMKDFEGMSLSKYSNEPGLFGYIDDTPIIFIFFGLITFIICFLLNSLTSYLAKRFSSHFEWVIPGIIILLIAFIVNIGNWPIWFAYSQFYQVFRNFATVLLPFILLRYIIFKTKSWEFSDKEVIKFFTIVIGTYVIGYLLSQIGFNLDSNRNDNVMMIENHGPHPMVMAFTIVIASGNLLANLVRHMISSRNTNKILKKTEIDLGKSNADLQSLQSNINPHFLYNSLNSIASTAKSDPEKTEEMALALSQFYNYVTNKKGQDTTILLAEEEMLDNYLQIEKIRFGDKLNVSFDFEEASHQCTLPRLLLQPIVENAIKYGYGDNDIKIKIVGTKSDQNLILKIYDSGPDFDDDMQIGYGIKSIMQKLQALYPDQHKIEFNNKPSKHVFISIAQ